MPGPPAAQSWADPSPFPRKPGCCFGGGSIRHTPQAPPRLSPLGPPCPTPSRALDDKPPSSASSVGNRPSIHRSLCRRFSPQNSKPPVPSTLRPPPRRPRRPPPPAGRALLRCPLCPAAVATNSEAPAEELVPVAVGAPLPSPGRSGPLPPPPAERPPPPG